MYIRNAWDSQLLCLYTIQRDKHDGWGRPNESVRQRSDAKVYNGEKAKAATEAEPQALLGAADTCREAARDAN